MDLSFLTQRRIPNDLLPDPTEQYQRSMTLQALAQRNETGQMQLDQTRRGVAAQNALNSALPSVMQGNWSDDAIRQAIQQNPESAGPLLDMLDKKRAADAANRKSNAGAAKDETDATAKAFSDISSAAFAEAKSPDHLSLSRVNSVARTYGKQLPAFSGDPQSPDDVQRYLASVGNMAYAAKDQVTNAETAGHNRATEANATDTLAENTRFHTGELGNSRITANAAASNAQTARDRLGMERDNNGKPVIQTDAEGNMYAVDPKNATGRPILDQQGKPLMKGGKPLTEVQGNATAYGMRMKASNDVLDSLESTGFNMGSLPSKVLPANAVSNYLASPEAQQAYQAKLNFMTASLRKESGAAISSSEFESEDKKYFPQPGDKPPAIEQKRQMRDLAIRAMSIQAGPGSKNIGAKGGGAGLQAAPSGSGVDFVYTP